MNNKYAKITIYDLDGEATTTYLEPLSLEHISIVLEDEFMDADEGTQVEMTIVEMSPEEYASARELEGYV